MSNVAPIHLDLDVPSGEIVWGEHWEALAPLPAGMDAFNINYREGMAACSLARAGEHLIHIYTPLLNWRASQNLAGDVLLFQRRGSRLVPGHTALRPDFSGVRYLGMMDAADCAHQAQVWGEEPFIGGRIPVKPGRYRFTLNYADRAFWADRPPAGYTYVRVQRIGPAQPVLRRSPGMPAAYFSESEALGTLVRVGQGARTYFSHPAQVLAHLLASMGNGYAWVHGQLASHRPAQIDTPAWVDTPLRPLNPPNGVRVPTFPAMTTLGPASVDDLYAQGDYRSVGLHAPLDVDRHWLALMLILFASLAQAPAVAGGSDPSNDAAHWKMVQRAYRLTCALVTATDRWAEMERTFAEMTAFIAELQVPAKAFADRQQMVTRARQSAPFPAERPE
jgi:hypothetical protein